ncbi:protein PHLOEM PROTEIN 2-LIKE A9-like [Vitis riparia]|uniref:protein PHLOEM PROTEIN 2-LIKE A9-like n=1 Tax=Vitis riparia TaxID=96939 RepID=UPI00155A50D6|nr:protein PHLOEM PROTEIN 2-LIKE A9-like [Vitis riparia]
MSSTTPHHDAEDPPQLQLKDGKLMATFNPRQLNVIWGRDPRYWKMPEKTSGGPAELLQVCLLEVSGSLPIRSSAPSGTKFRITFQVSFKSDAFGWNNCPVCVMAKFGKKGKYTWTKITLRTDYSRPTNILPSPEGLEITKDASNANDTIYFGLYEVWSGKWKGGLELHNATVEQINNK